MAWEVCEVNVRIQHSMPLSQLFGLDMGGNALDHPERRASALLASLHTMDRTSVGPLKKLPAGVRCTFFAGEEEEVQENH